MQRQQILQQWNMTEQRFQELCQTCLLPTDQDDYTAHEWERLDLYQRVIFEGSPQLQKLFAESIQWVDPLELHQHFDRILREIQLFSRDHRQRPRKDLIALFKTVETIHHVSLSLKTGAHLLAVSGLPEKDFYSPSEYDTFLETCRLHYQEGLTLEQLRDKHGGPEPDPSHRLKEQLGLSRGEATVQQLLDGHQRFVAQFEEEVNFYAMQEIARAFKAGAFRPQAQAPCRPPLTKHKITPSSPSPQERPQVIDAHIIDIDS